MRKLQVLAVIGWLAGTVLAACRIAGLIDTDFDVLGLGLFAAAGVVTVHLAIDKQATTTRRLMFVTQPLQEHQPPARVLQLHR